LNKVYQGKRGIGERRWGGAVDIGSFFLDIWRDIGTLGAKWYFPFSCGLDITSFRRYREDYVLVQVVERSM
jgi:hypothetical protein